MREISILDRILLLGTGLLSAYQIAIGIEGLSSFVMINYMIAFGVLLIASLLLIIFGFEILNSSALVVIAALIPLGLSLGLVSQYASTFQEAYFAFTILGLLAILISRVLKRFHLATLIISIVHGIAGLIITFLPIALVLQGEVDPGFLLVGLGGALIGIGGLLFSFLRVGKPIISAERLYSALPILLLLMTASFVAGMAAG